MIYKNFKVRTYVDRYEKYCKCDNVKFTVPDAITVETIFYFSNRMFTFTVINSISLNDFLAINNFIKNIKQNITSNLYYSDILFAYENNVMTINDVKIENNEVFIKFFEYINKINKYSKKGHMTYDMYKSMGKNIEISMLPL